MSALVLLQQESLMKHIDIASMPIANVLVIVAHPDDIESWCAGTVCRFTDADRQVAYVLCTSGDKGTSDPTQTPQQVAAMREAEQVEAARILGVETITFLRLPDSEVEPTLTLRRELVRQIRRHRPDLVITHDPVPPYRLHPDHRAVGRATLDALFPCARDPLTFAEQIREEGLQAHTVPQAWLSTRHGKTHLPLGDGMRVPFLVRGLGGWGTPSLPT